MTRKDFEAIAAAIRMERDYKIGTAVSPVDAQQMACAAIAIRLADYLATTNPNFRRSAFMDAALGTGKDGGE